MKKILIYFFITILLGSAPVISARELKEILRSGELRVAIVNTGTAPFITKNLSGKYKGFEIDFMRACAKLMDVGLELIPAEGHDNMVDMVACNKADLAIGFLSVTPTRALKVSFSTPYVRSHLALLVNRQAMLRMRGTFTLEHFLRNYNGSLLIREQSSYHRDAKELFPYAMLKSYKIDEIDQLIRTKKIEALLAGQSTIRILMERNTGSRVFFQRVILEDTVDNIAIAVSPDCPQLLHFINIMLDCNMAKIEKIVKPEL